MSFDLPHPHKGDRLSASRTAKMLSEIKANRVIPTPGCRVVRGPLGTAIHIDPPQTAKAKDRPYPYEVRFDYRLDNDDGGWKIYLPTEHLLSYDGEYIATSDITGITPIEDADSNPTGWYEFDDIDLDADHVWLVVTPSSSSSGTVNAEFTADDGQDSGESGGESETPDNAIRICIAEVSYTAPETATSAAQISISQSVVGAIRLETGVTPDDASTELVPHDNTSGADNANEGKLQIKGWSTGTPTAVQTLAALLSASSPSGHLVLRDTDGTLTYLPIGSLASILAEIVEPDNVSTELVPHDSSSGADNAGEGKLQIKGWKAGTPVSSQSLAAALLSQSTPSSGAPYIVSQDSNGALVYIPIGSLASDIGAARTPLSSNKPQDVVLSTGQASAGGANTTTASKSDHVHKLPNTVVDTVNDQTIEAVKTFQDGSSHHGYLVFDPSGQAEDKVYIRVWYGSNAFDMWVGPNDTGTSGTGNFLSLKKMPDGSRLLRLGTNVSNQQQLRASPTIDPNDSSSFTSDMQKQIATLGWVDAHYLGKLKVGEPTVTALSPGAQPTATVTLSASTQGGKEDTLNFSFGIPGGAASTVPGPQGVGIASVTSNTRAATSSGGYTTTPVTVTLTNNTSLTPFNVVAKDGNDGVGIVAIQAGTATSAGGYTTTPVTVTLTDDTTLSFSVQAKDGSPGGGSSGGGGGVDISALNGVTLVTNVEWIGSPTYAIRVTKRTASVANGVLTLGAAQTSDITTTPLSGESSGGTST